MLFGLPILAKEVFMSHCYILPHPVSDLTLWKAHSTLATSTSNIKWNTSSPAPWEPPLCSLKCHSLSSEPLSPSLQTFPYPLINNSYIFLQNSSFFPCHFHLHSHVKKEVGVKEYCQEGRRYSLPCILLTGSSFISLLLSKIEGSYTSWNKFLSSLFSLSFAFSIIIFIAEISVRIHSESFYEAAPSVPSVGMTFPSL